MKKTLILIAALMLCIILNGYQTGKYYIVITKNNDMIEGKMIYLEESSFFIIETKEGPSKKINISDVFEIIEKEKPLENKNEIKSLNNTNTANSDSVKTVKKYYSSSGTTNSSSVQQTNTYYNYNNNNINSMMKNFLQLSLGYNPITSVTLSYDNGYNNAKKNESYRSGIGLSGNINILSNNSVFFLFGVDALINAKKDGVINDDYGTGYKCKYSITNISPNFGFRRFLTPDMSKKPYFFGKIGCNFMKYNVDIEEYGNESLETNLGFFYNLGVGVLIEKVNVDFQLSGTYNSLKDDSNFSFSTMNLGIFIGTSLF